LTHAVGPAWQTIDRGVPLLERLSVTTTCEHMTCKFLCAFDHIFSCHDPHLWPFDLKI